jgi:hypothetical protein
MISWRALRRASVLPIQLAHECAHVAAAAPWADEWAVVISQTGDPAMAHIVFDDETPDVAEAFVHLAPFLAGLVGAIVAGAVLVAEGITPAGTGDLLLWSAGAMAWVLFAKPSSTDLAGALAALQDADDGGDESLEAPSSAAPNSHAPPFDTGDS